MKQYAPEWTQYANIKFTFVDSGQVDILIAFSPSSGSWSYIGTDGLYLSSLEQPSMNLGFINENKPEDQIRSSILHEFGHALGAAHEYERPLSDILWNKERIYRDLGGSPNHWDKATVDQNMSSLYATQEVQSTDFDPDSIMLFYYPASWTLNGKGTKYNTELSEKDKAYIKTCYPPDAINSGRFDTSEVSQPNEQLQKYGKVFNYQKKYDVNPELPVGITSLEMSGGIRIKAYISHITKETFKASLLAGSDTILHSASMTFLEKGSDFSYMQTGVYNTQETCSWGCPQTAHSKRINFATPFNSPPKVITWLQALDMDETNWRVSVYPTDINESGFTVHVDSREDSVLHSAGVTWLAYPADQVGVASGHFDTRGARSCGQPQLENSGSFEFPEAFQSTPKVIMALDSLDYDTSEKLCVRLSVSTVTNTHITWNFQSSSTMNSSGASFFAWI